MKQLKNILLATFVLVFNVNMQAQNSGLDYSKLTKKSNRLEGKLMGDAYFITAAANNYFFLTDWVIGNIFLTDSDIIEEAQFRFLISENELIFYNQQIRNLFKLDKDIIQRFVFEDSGKKRIFNKIYFDGINSGDRYFEILCEGNKTLLANHSVYELKVSPYKDKYGVLRDTEFQKRIEYYLYSPNSGFDKIAIKRRAFYKLYPKQKKEIRKIFRQNRMYFNSQNELIQAVTLLNQAGLLN